MTPKQVFEGYDGPKFSRRVGLKWEVGIGWNRTIEGFGTGGMQVTRTAWLFKSLAVWRCLWGAMQMGCPGILESLNKA